MLRTEKFGRGSVGFSSGQEVSSHIPGVQGHRGRGAVARESLPIPASNIAVERTGHTTGFVHGRVSVGCGPPLTVSVRPPTEQTGSLPKQNG